MKKMCIYKVIKSEKITLIIEHIINTSNNIGKMNNALEADCETIAIEPEIVPYMLTSEIDELNYWLTANGNKPVISQEESVEKAGLSSNVELTMQKLKDQATTENSFIIGEPQLEMDA